MKERRTNSKVKPYIFFGLECIAVFFIVSLFYLGNLEMQSIGLALFLLINPIERLIRISNR